MSLPSKNLQLGAKYLEEQQEIKTYRQLKPIYDIVKQFIVARNLIMYGGTAINDSLPKNLQFYDSEYELPDFDVFSMNPQKDITDICDIAL